MFENSSVMFLFFSSLETADLCDSIYTKRSTIMQREIFQHFPIFSTFGLGTCFCNSQGTRFLLCLLTHPVMQCMD